MPSDPEDFDELFDQVSIRYKMVVDSGSYKKHGLVLYKIRCSICNCTISEPTIFPTLRILSHENIHHKLSPVVPAPKSTINVIIKRMKEEASGQ